MREYLEISFDAVDPKAASFQRWVVECEALGFDVSLKYGGGSWHRLLAPVGDDSWRKRVQKAEKAGLIDCDWREDCYVQVYSEEDVQAAPLFSLVYVGRDIDIPTGRDNRTGLCHFTEVDLSNLCKQCNAGGMQGAPLRLRGSELNRSGRFADIALASNDFYLLAESLADSLAEECSCELPLREIETYGATKAKERWYQLDPQCVVPAEAIRLVHACPPRTCAECGASWFESLDGVFGSYSTVRAEVLADLDLPPVVLDPFVGGELSRLPDGRVISFPSRRPWLRGDVGRALARKKIKGLTLTPIITA